MVEIGTILKGATLALSAAKYFGLIQDHLRLKVEQLAGSELEAGFRALEQAAYSETEKDTLLREARSRFNKATCLEEGFHQAAAYLGLALCHLNLGDSINAEKAIGGFVQVSPPQPPLLLKVGRHYNDKNLSQVMVDCLLPGLSTLHAVGRLIGYATRSQIEEHDEAVKLLIQHQKEGKRLLDQSLRDGCDRVFSISTN
jgi:hypothetical protein